MSKKGWTEVPKTGTARGIDGYRHSKQAERKDSTKAGIGRGEALRHKATEGSVRKVGRGSKQGV